jgi:RNA polymerase primary sigma factor
VSRALSDQGRTIRLPTHVAERVRRLLRARRHLAQKLSREPTPAELAKETGETEEKVVDLLGLVDDPVSLDSPIGDGESAFADLIEDERSAQPDERTAIEHRHGELARAIDQLAPRMQRVLVLRFGLDGEGTRTLEDIGSELGVTRERVRQLESRALRELRNRAPGLELYLSA